MRYDSLLFTSSFDNRIVKWVKKLDVPLAASLYIYIMKKSYDGSLGILSLEYLRILTPQ